MTFTSRDCLQPVRDAAILSIVLSTTLAWPNVAHGQEERAAAQDAVDQEGGRRCDLTWEPATEETVARIFRQTEDAQITYVSGGMVWTCGTATMEADSAVKYDLAYQVDLIGNVRYRDTIRTLESEELTYYELADRIVATGDVFLTRLSSGSTLEGPRVEFLRAVSGVDEVTLATGRPHMVLRPEDDPDAEPFEVDADETEFLGEEEARARGSVEIVRSDLQAAADSAHFRLGDGSGVLYGEPWIEGEAFRLEGDTIRTTFENNELKSVLAAGTGHATGESFEVVSEDILVGIVKEEIDAVWAYGAGRSLAISGGHRVYGDSLRFVMLEGRIDSVLAIREAAAVQAINEDTDAGTADPRERIAPSISEDGQPDVLTSPADSLAARADTVSVPADSLAAPAEVPAAATDTVAAPADTLAASADTLAGRLEDAGATAESDSAAFVPDMPAEAGADTLPSPADTTSTPSDTTSTPADTLPAETSDRVPPPRLAVDASTNWVSGDTLYATFKRPVADSSAALPADSAAADTGVGSPAAADTAEAELERLRVVGGARSYYAAVRDTTRTDRPSRSYLMGRAIDVVFKDGEAQRVIGEDAIGLYLDPTDVEGGVPAPQPGARPGEPEGLEGIPGPRSDSLPEVPARDTTPPDSVASRAPRTVGTTVARKGGAVESRSRSRGPKESARRERSLGWTLNG